jgi:hypothetical protein
VTKLDVTEFFQPVRGSPPVDIADFRAWVYGQEIGQGCEWGAFHDLFLGLLEISKVV